MNMDWMAVAVIITGLCCICAATNMDQTASFESPSFAGEIILAAGGVMTLITGVGLLAISTLLLQG